MPLVEREVLLERLAGLRADAQGGAGRLVLVQGEAGAGKTALVRAALSGADARWGWCEPLTLPRPLGPFRDLLDVGQDGPVAVGERLLAELRGRPTVLVVEDAHWVDEATADVLRYLGRRIESSCGLLVVTARGDEAGPDHPLRQALGDLSNGPALVRLDVPALTRDGVAELLADSGRDVDEVVRVTGGNAFLVDQLATSPEPTAAVRDSVAARVTRLSPAARVLVRELSVVTGRVPVAVVRTASELDEAVRAGLLDVHDGSVGFRHELVRMAVETDLAPGERRAAHARAMDRVGDAEPAVLAFHARGAGLVELAHGLELDAATRARRSGAHRQAAAHLRQALADPRTGPDADHVRLWLDLAVEERAIGHEAASAEAVDEARALAEGTGDVRLRGLALVWAGRTARADPDAARFAQEAIDLLAPLGPSPELAMATATLATVEMIGRRLESATVRGREAVALAEEAGDPATLSTALQALGAALTLSGRDDEGAVLRRAVAAAADIDTEASRAWANLVSSAGEQRSYAVALAAADEALVFFAARDLDAWSGYTRAWRARCLFEQGRWSEATREVDQVLAAGSDDDITVVAALTTQGRIRARRGDPGSWESLDRALRLAETYQSLQRIGPVAAGRAELRWLSGAADDGADGLRAAYALARERDSPWLLGELALWTRRHGLPAGPRGDLDRVAEPYRLQLGDDQRGAGDAWESLGCPYEAADAWSGSADEGDVRRALDRAHELGAGPLGRRAARRLRELGVRSVPRGPREATAEHPDGLTAREQEVLGWLHEGHTDAEIAAGLHLSVKTVGHHVSAVLRKTGVTSRRELQRPTDGV